MRVSVKSSIRTSATNKLNKIKEYDGIEFNPVSIVAKYLGIQNRF